MSLRAGDLCPQCNGTTLGVFPEVSLGCKNTRGRISMGALSLTLYTCGECGFSEVYVSPPVVSWDKPPGEQGLEFEWIRPPPA